MSEIAKFASIADMKRKTKDAGSFFFSEGAMAFFNSKIVSPLINQSFFITSEYMDDPAEKRYTPRYFTLGEDGRYEHHDIGEFNVLETEAEARAAIFEFQHRAVMKRRVESALAEVGLTPGIDKNDGEPTLNRADGEFIHGEAFGADSEDRSGVRLYEIRDIDIVTLGDFATPRGFADYVRGKVDGIIERQD